VHNLAMSQNITFIFLWNFYSRSVLLRDFMCCKCFQAIQISQFWISFFLWIWHEKTINRVHWKIILFNFMCCLDFVIWFFIACALSTSFHMLYFLRQWNLFRRLYHLADFMVLLLAYSVISCFIIFVVYWNCLFLCIYTVLLTRSSKNCLLFTALRM
jgi:hypothetical protein